MARRSPNLGPIAFAAILAGAAAAAALASAGSDSGFGAASLSAFALLVPCAAFLFVGDGRAAPRRHRRPPAPAPPRGTYLARGCELYRLEHSAGTEAILENCRTEELVGLPAADLRRFTVVEGRRTGRSAGPSG